MDKQTFEIMNDITTTFNEMNSIIKTNKQYKLPQKFENSETNINKILEKNALLYERIIALDIILKMYPNLEKNKTAILNKILCVKEKKKDQAILSKIYVNGLPLYKDNQGFIIDKHVKVVGIYIFINNKPQFCVGNKKTLTDTIINGVCMLKKIEHKNFKN